MSRPQHRHDRFHRGYVPESQLGSGTPTDGYALTATGTGTAAWEATSGEVTQAELDEISHIHVVNEVGVDGDATTMVWYLANYADTDSIAAYVAGDRTSAFTHSDGDKITFSAAPANGAEIVFDYIAEEA